MRMRLDGEPPRQRMKLSWAAWFIEVADITRGIIPIPKDSEESAREHAYHTTPKGWERDSKGPTADAEAGSYDLSSSEDHQCSVLESPRLVKQEKLEAFLLWFIPALVTWRSEEHTSELQSP